jgi:hypothetical protein
MRSGTPIWYALIMGDGFVDASLWVVLAVPSFIMAWFALISLEVMCAIRVAWVSGLVQLGVSVCPFVICASQSVPCLMAAMAPWIASCVGSSSSGGFGLVYVRRHLSAWGCVAIYLCHG